MFWEAVESGMWLWALPLTEKETYLLYLSTTPDLPTQDLQEDFRPSTMGPQWWYLAPTP